MSRPVRKATTCVAALAAALATAYAGSGPGAAPAPGLRPAQHPSHPDQAVQAVQADHPDHGVRIPRRRAIGANAPEEVLTGSVISVNGTVAVRTGRRPARPVSLLERTRWGTWRAIARKWTTRSGGFRFRVASGSVGRARAFRVEAPRHRRLPSVTTSPMRVRVTARTTPAEPTTETPTGDWDPAEYPAAGEPAALGSAADWRLMYDGGGRWDPCTVIRWAYYGSGSYPGSLADMKRSFARIAGITGLHFKYVGTTEYVPFADQPTGTFPAGADLAVGWSDSEQVQGLDGGVVGLGGGEAAFVSGKDVAYRIDRGHIVFDREEVLRPGFETSGSPTWGQVMQHEALHVLGLHHARGSAQIMYGTVWSGNHRFGAGDLAGMDRIGASRGCL